MLEAHVTMAGRSPGLGVVLDKNLSDVFVSHLRIPDTAIQRPCIEQLQMLHYNYLFQFFLKQYYESI